MSMFTKKRNDTTDQIESDTAPIDHSETKADVTEIDENQPEEKTIGTEPVLHGKKWSTEKFSTVRSAETIAKLKEEQAKYEDPNAIPLSVYFANRRVNDLVQRSMMEAFTPIRKATQEAFDEIFKNF